MFKVILAGPNHLDRSTNCTGNLHCFHNEISFDSTAKSAAYQSYMEGDGFERKSADSRSNLTSRLWMLGWCPHLTLIGLNIGSTIHWLHRSVCQKRRLIDGFNRFVRTREALISKV